ncbi:CPBP family intramembrane metalloprotease [Altererythrobacter salegens]|uniref:CPBP family intramembrane metalloprotease n=1 Tax=Croceibacterium salegens TaxID=1737568 RepID=A0A6I4SVF1_9SPHN|nr:CPBP family intramembrane glutamic endopeptidase [Croceibacterium salegens]MXO60015.1 CPBP family intramembrane metalloprotease [Croceibacterium salegens]
MSIATALILFACWWLPPLMLALVLKVTGQTELDWRWFGVAALTYALYSLAGYWTLPADVASLPAEARWYSRIAQLAIGALIAALLWKRHKLLTAEGLGLTFRQKPGSLPWSLLGIALLVTLGLMPGGMDAGAGDVPGSLGLLYHLTLPGIEEELMYRGLEVSLLSAALGGTAKAIGWAAVMATMVFALAHGIVPNGATIGVSPFMIGYVALAGTILVAMRLKSGSLVLPAVGHNLIGLAMRLA